MTFSIQKIAEEFPPPQQTFFVGRQKQLERLQEIFNKKASCVLIPAEDINDKIGKTALAIHYAQKQKVVIWIDSRKQKSLVACYQKLSEKLSTSIEKVKEVLSQYSLLIIFDGAKNSEMIKNYLPNGHCKVLITSRNRVWDKSKIELGPFSLEEAIDFLCKRIGKIDLKEAEQIAKLSDLYPPSLEKAAQQMITKQAQSNDLFSIRKADEKRSKVVVNVPFRNRNFLGRESFLRAIKNSFETNSSLQTTDQRRIVCLIGLGGIGKTQIAIEYADRNFDEYALICWIPGAYQNSTLASYFALARALGITLTETEKKEKNILIKKVNNKLEHLKYLLIFDDIQGQEDIEKLLPEKGGHILITSRNIGWTLPEITIFRVGPFERSESITIFQRMTSLNEQEANQIARLVHDFPLAVAQAAAYIEENRISAHEYIFLEQNKKLFGFQRPSEAFSKVVNVMWKFSMERICNIEKEQAEKLKAPYPVAIPLMDVCAYFDSLNIPKGLLLKWWSLKSYRGNAALADLDRTLKNLQDFSMIKCDERGISLHPLVQLFIQSQQELENKEKIIKKALKALNKTYILEPKTFSERQTNQSLFLHFKRILGHSDKLSPFPKRLLPSYMQTLFRLADIYGEQEEYLFQMYHLKLAWIIAEKLDDQNNAAKFLNELGLTALKFEKPNEALIYFEKAVSIMEKKFGIEHPNLSTYVNNLGLAWEELKEIEKASSYYERAINLEKNFSKGLHYTKGLPEYKNEGVAKLFRDRAQELANITLLELQNPPKQNGIWWANKMIKNLKAAIINYEIAKRKISLSDTIQQIEREIELLQWKIVSLSLPQNLQLYLPNESDQNDPYIRLFLHRDKLIETATVMKMVRELERDSSHFSTSVCFFLGFIYECLRDFKKSSLMYFSLAEIYAKEKKNIFLIHECLDKAKLLDSTIEEKRGYEQLRKNIQKKEKIIQQEFDARLKDIKEKSAFKPRCFIISDQLEETQNLIETKLYNDLFKIGATPVSVLKDKPLHTPYPVFSSDELNKADFIILLCAPILVEQAKNESSLLKFSMELLMSNFLGGTNKKIIPLLFQGEWKEAHPAYFTGDGYIDITSKEKYYRNSLKAFCLIKQIEKENGENFFEILENQLIEKKAEIEKND